MISLNKDFLSSLIKDNNNSLWRINKMDYKQSSHHLIKYNKPLLETNDYMTKGIYRSIIYDETKNKILSFAPPKTLSHTCEEFLNEWNNEDIRIEEFIDGIMIQVYYNGFKWEIATRSIITANKTFYHTYKTFKTMFYEACNFANLNIECLNQDYVYSFVMQHPDNKIVVHIDTPKLYLVDIFRLIDNKHTTNVEYITLDKQIYNATLDQTQPLNVHYPTIYHTNTSQDDISEYKTKYCGKDTDYNIIGIIIKNIKSGKRCKLRNPNYNLVKRLRGNQPNMIYRYIEALKKKSVEQYLHYFEEDKPFFIMYKTRLSQYIKELHNHYISCYIKKAHTSKEYPLLFRYHMYHLHKQYKQSKKNIYQDDVKQYIYNLDNSDIFNIIHFFSDQMISYS